MLRDVLQEDQIKALKSHDSVRLETLRYILAQIKNKEIEKKAPLADEETISTLQKIAKQMEESLEAFKKCKSADFAASNQTQFYILKTYLPAQLSDEEINTEIKKVMEANKAAIEANPKILIGMCMKELRGRADGNRIMRAIQSLQTA
jgi:uncharacterized protein YqeY